MVGYSATPLVAKLGIKSNFRLYTKNAPEFYIEYLENLSDDLHILKRISKDLDLIHIFTNSRKELAEEIPKYIKFIKQTGMIWVSWPKKASKLPSDITEDVIRAVILPLGLVDVKVCAVDDVWSGLKLVIRRENRKKS